MAFRNPLDILNLITYVIEGQQFNNLNPPKHDQLLVLGPSDAEALANFGWSKLDIKHFIYENAQLPVWKIKSAGIVEKSDPEKWHPTFNDNTKFPRLRGPEYLQIVDAGGYGSHNSVYVPGQDKISTEEIDKYIPKNWDMLLSVAKNIYV